MCIRLIAWFKEKQTCRIRRVYVSFQDKLLPLRPLCFFVWKCKKVSTSFGTVTTFKTAHTLYRMTAISKQRCSPRITFRAGHQLGYCQGREKGQVRASKWACPEHSLYGSNCDDDASMPMRTVKNTRNSFWSSPLLILWCVELIHFPFIYLP